MYVVAPTNCPLYGSTEECTYLVRVMDVDVLLRQRHCPCYTLSKRHPELFLGRVERRGQTRVLSHVEEFRHEVLVLPTPSDQEQTPPVTPIK